MAMDLERTYLQVTAAAVLSGTPNDEAPSAL